MMPFHFTSHLRLQRGFRRPRAVYWSILFLMCRGGRTVVIGSLRKSWTSEPGRPLRRWIWSWPASGRAGSPYPICVYYLHAQEERGRKVRPQGFCCDCFSGDTDADGSAAAADYQTLLYTLNCHSCRQWNGMWNVDFRFNSSQVPKFHSFLSIFGPIIQSRCSEARYRSQWKSFIRPILNWKTHCRNVPFYFFNVKLSSVNFEKNDSLPIDR
jgi:hypothetical protein